MGIGDLDILLSGPTAVAYPELLRRTLGLGDSRPLPEPGNGTREFLKLFSLFSHFQSTVELDNLTITKEREQRDENCRDQKNKNKQEQVAGTRRGRRSPKRRD